MAPGPSSALPRPFGPYELVRRLARGEDAEVFLARARSVAGFEKAVALKMIHPSLGEDPEFARHLVEEANIAARLGHKNIVQVIDLGQINGLHYIAMEYVDGLDLGKLSLRMAAVHAWPLAPRVAAYILREVCEGLDHAHRKTSPDGKPLGIVHRDVSPSNILVSFSGEVKLTDFGLARASLRAATRAGDTRGRYSYMAPEVVRGAGVDARADVFSAGAVLYELLTGQPAYPSAPADQAIERALSGRYAPPESLRPDLPQALGDILRRAMAADPARRYPTARPLVEDLASFLYTLPPNPEMDLARMLETSTDTSRNVLQPLGALLVDDASDEVTQIETAATIRARILNTPRTIAAAPPPPLASFPLPDSLPPPRPSTDPPRISGGIARVRGRLARGSAPATPAPPIAPSAPPISTTAPTLPPPTRRGGTPVRIPAPPRVAPIDASCPPEDNLPTEPVPSLRDLVPPSIPLRGVTKVLDEGPEMPLRPSPSVVRAPTLPAMGRDHLAQAPLVAPTLRPVVRAATLAPTGLAPATPVNIAPEISAPVRAAEPYVVPRHAPTRSQQWALIAAGLLALASLGVLVAVVLHSR